MTAYRITSTTSRFTSTSDAFEEHSSGADSLTVDEGAYLVATGSPYDAAQLDSQGAWKVTINGSLYAATSGGWGIYLTSGNTATSTISIGATGEVAGGTISIAAYSAANIQNAGLVANQIVLGGGRVFSVTNSGTIGPDVFNPGTMISGASSGQVTLNNSGHIFGNVVLGSGNDSVTNSGDMDQINFGDGDNKLTTTADSVTSIVYGGIGNDTISTAGRVASLQLGNGSNSTTIAATGSLGSYLGGTGNDVIKLAGRIDGGFGLDEGNNSLTVTGVAYGVQVNGSITAGAGNDTIVNSGYLEMILGVSLGNGTNVVTNSKTFIADLGLGNGVNTVTNSGTFTGDIASTGKLTFTNSGLFTGDINSGGALTFNNTGTFTAAAVIGSSEIDNFTNKKTVIADIFLSTSEDIFTNSGTVDGDVSGESGHDTFKNTGIITGAIIMGDSSFYGGELTNSGTIQRNVKGGFDADHVTNTGHINGLVDLGDGDDVYTGGNYVDHVADGAGSDTIKLGGGNDIYDGDGGTTGDGIDIVDAGAGIDTFVATHSTADSFVSTTTTTQFFINIDTIIHDEDAFIAIGANYATGPAFDLDRVYNFENVTGGNAEDLIYGNAAANILKGLDGADGIFGFGGNDQIAGGSGADTIGGGAGADRLEGGTGADRFVYNLASDSGPGKAARDIIVDFEDASDKIDMSSMDSDSKTTGIQQNLHFVGTNVAFGLNDAGEVRAIQTAAGYTIEADLSGDGKADFAIDVLDADHSIVFTSSDFLFH